MVNHSPICTCPPNHLGNPFISCTFREEPRIPQDPCSPSPCGPNSQCREINGVASCGCLLGYVGAPPNCRPECIIDQDCASDRSCRQMKCTDPCQGLCGVNAHCRTVAHSPNCYCNKGYIGDAFNGCHFPPAQEEPKVNIIHIDPCNPSPCGSNAVCTARNGAGSCKCIDLHFGDPYTGCRPECVVNADCPQNKACTRNKCVGNKKFLLRLLSY